MLTHVAYAAAATVRASVRRVRASATAVPIGRGRPRQLRTGRPVSGSIGAGVVRLLPLSSVGCHAVQEWLDFAPVLPRADGGILRVCLFHLPQCRLPVTHCTHCLERTCPRRYSYLVQPRILAGGEYRCRCVVRRLQRHYTAQQSRLGCPRTKRRGAYCIDGSMDFICVQLRGQAVGIRSPLLPGEAVRLPPPPGALSCNIQRCAVR